GTASGGLRADEARLNQLRDKRGKFLRVFGMQDLCYGCFVFHVNIDDMTRGRLTKLVVCARWSWPNPGLHWRLAGSPAAFFRSSGKAATPILRRILGLRTWRCICSARRWAILSGTPGQMKTKS